MKKDETSQPKKATEVVEEVVDLDQLIKGMQDVYATRGPPKERKDFLNFDPKDAIEKTPKKEDKEMEAIFKNIQKCTNG